MIMNEAEFGFKDDVCLCKSITNTYQFLSGFGLKLFEYFRIHIYFYQ